MTCNGTECQAGHAIRETDRHKGHCCRAAEALDALEEGTAPPAVAAARRHCRDNQCILISPWGSLQSDVVLNHHRHRRRQ